VVIRNVTVCNYLMRLALTIVLVGFYDSRAVIAQATFCDCFIQGIVRDHHSHLPIPGATVLIEGQNKGVLTDAAGNYRISGLCAGTYILESRIVGYQPVKQTIDLHAGHKEDFDLEEDEVHLHAVEISANRTDAPSSQSLTTLIGSELNLTRGNSLAESLKGVTGVSTLQTGSSIAKPVIHGLHSNRVLIINNGVRQEGQQWGSEHAPEIDPFVAKRLSVVKGAAGVRYGSDALFS
jgi:iron complex outermembrane receptor protein